MTIVKLYPVVAAAGVCFAIWFFFAYRFHQRELAGEDSFKQIIWLFLLPGGLLLFFWLHGFKAPLISPLDFFMATLTGLSFAAIIVYSIQQAFMTPGIARKQRVSSIIYLTIFTAMIGGSMFIW